MNFKEVFNKFVRSDNFRAVLTKYVGMVLVFIAQVIFLKVVSTKEYGLFVQLVAWANIFGTVGAFGQMTYLTKNVAISSGAGSYTNLYRQLKVSFSIVLILYLLFLLFFSLINSRIGIAESSEANNIYVLVFAGLVALTAVQRVLSGLNRGLGFAVFELFNINITKPVVQLIFFGGLYLIYSAENLNYIDLGLSLVASLVAIVLALGVKPLISMSRQVKSGNHANDVVSDDSVGGILQQVKRQLRESIPFTLLNTVTAVEKNIDLIVVGYLLGASAAGVYGFITRLHRLSNVAQSTLNAVFGSKAANRYSKGDYKGLHALSRSITKFNVANALLFFLVYSVFAGFILSMIDPELEVGLIPLLVLSFAGVIRSLAGPVSVTANMTGNQVSALRITLLTLAFGTVCIYLLTTLFGMLGTAIAVALMSVSRAWLLRRMLSGKLQTESNAA